MVVGAGSTLVEAPSAYIKEEKKTTVKQQEQAQTTERKKRGSPVFETHADETTARPSPALSPQPLKSAAAAEF